MNPTILGAAGYHQSIFCTNMSAYCDAIFDEYCLEDGTELECRKLRSDLILFPSILPPLFDVIADCIVDGKATGNKFRIIKARISWCLDFSLSLLKS